MLVRNIQRRVKRQRLKDDMVAEGLRRAKVWGWPNIYTYTKFMAEAILAARLPPERFTVFRPAIVESALEYPFPGWNQGFNTSGPLIYLTQGWFRHVPARDDNPFDVIPVDHVCKGLTVASAALLDGIHAPVYQYGSSDAHRLTIGRAVELTALAHRKHLRRRGDSAVERVVLARWDTIVSEVDHLLSVRNLRSVTEGLQRVAPRGPLAQVPAQQRRRHGQEHRRRARHHRHHRQGRRPLPALRPRQRLHLRLEGPARPPAVEPEFHCHPNSIDWRAYWIDIHVPGLRKWCFPLFENKTPRATRPATPSSSPPRPPPTRRGSPDVQRPVRRSARRCERPRRAGAASTDPRPRSHPRTPSTRGPPAPWQSS
jgi:hypothetical protein